MNRRDVHRLTLAGLVLPACTHVLPSDREPLRTEVSRTIEPLMQQHQIPGMSVGLIRASERHSMHFGVASLESRQAVHDGTLFEIGSLSKTFTGLLGGYAAANARLAWNDPVTRHMPELRGSRFDDISVLSLATYTAGGLPLQVPGEVRGEAAMLAYYRAWQPVFPPDTRRQYSNASIGLFGHLAARSLGTPFISQMQRLLPVLGLRDTFYEVPANRMADYAWGHREGRTIRVSSGQWDAEAYGVKTTAADVLRFIGLHLAPQGLEPELRQAVEAATTGYYRVGQMAQGLGWELYKEGSSLQALVDGNSTAMALEPQVVTRAPASSAALVNKTGSTNGFGAYAVFDRSRGTGVVLLANRNYPNAERVRAAYRLLEILS